MRRLVSILAALAVVAMLSGLTWRARRAHKNVTDDLEGADRYVNMSVLLRVVEQDPDGVEYFPGKPKLRILREHRLGGIVDTSGTPRICERAKTPAVVWYCSAISEPLILHGDDLPPRILEEGAMGAGKTTDLGQWLFARAIEFTGTGAELGATAPTTVRLRNIKQAIMDMWPAAWWRWKERDSTFTLANGVAIQLVSTHQASADAGSPIQGFNWPAAASDELQDSLKVDGDIEARGRDAPDGNFKRFATCTVKDSPSYRSWKARSSKAARDTGEMLWSFVQKRGVDSPFVALQYWEDLKQTMTKAEYERKALAIDGKSERAVYYAFDRKYNVRPRQQVPRWPDVTARELRQWGNNLEILVGFDPGSLVNVSVLLKAYQPPPLAPTRQKPNPPIPDPVWFVIGEVVSPRSTTDKHCRELLKYVREGWGCNQTSDGPQIFVRGDPSTNSGNDENSPDMTVFVTLAKHGIQAKAAAYKPGSVKHGRVPKEGRLEMVNTLFHSEDGSVRLVVQTDDRGNLAAPKLVEALELLERNGDWKAEADRKDENDKTHLPCALGYALWSIEKPRLDARRAG